MAFSFLSTLYELLCLLFSLVVLCKCPFFSDWFILIPTAFYPEVNRSFSHDMDDEYEKLFRRMNPPRYVNFCLLQCL
jgi:hypothetical protein